MSPFRFLPFLLLLPALTLAQPQLRLALETHHQRTVQEKLYAHTDQSVYVTGETIWFRLFCVDASAHKPLSISRVAYVDLLDSEQKPSVQATVALGADGGAGSLNLPVSLASGTYVLRAYTGWMRGTSPDFLFEKTITLINPFRQPKRAVRTDSLAWAVQCFPEGGQLVGGLPARVAVHATDLSTGRGVAYRGVVLGDSRDTLARFSAHRFGMGTFGFTPQAGRTYRVLLTDERGRTVMQPLPPVAQTGYTLQLGAADNDQLRVTVRSNVPGAANADLLLLGHTRQVVGVAERLTLRDGQATLRLPANRLGEGISHLTLFDAAGRPLCERLWFRRPQPNLLTQLTTDKVTYSSRSPVALTIRTERPDGTPGAAQASVAVFRLDSLTTSDVVNLSEYLWLTSDLAGPVEQPAYYLTQTGPDADLARDHLMLTHGWRRFRWPDLLQPANLPTPTLPERRGPTVRGRVTDSRTGQPVAGVGTYLSVPGRGSRLYTQRSDRRGFVRFELDSLYGPHELVLQTTTPDSSYRVELLPSYADAPVRTVPLRFDLQPSSRDALTSRSLAMQVQQLYYAPPAPTAPPDSSTFYGKPDEHYNLDAYTRFQTLEEVLSEYVPGVAVRRQGGRFSLRVNNLPILALFEQSPLLLLDGVPVFDTDRLMALSPLRIRTLDVVTRRYFQGAQMYPGIVGFNTYKTDLAGYTLDPRAVVVDFDGLQARREFAAPTYATPAQQASRLPDFRQLLYWNPYVTTNASGRADLRFYTADQTGTYLIITQALTADGRFATGSQTFTVQGAN